MRAEWIDTVLSDEGPVGHTRRLVGLAIAKHSKSDGTGAFPSERTLEKETALNRRTVRQSLGELVSTGWLTKEVMGKGRYGRPTSKYSLSMPRNGASSVPLRAHDKGSSSDPTQASEAETHWSRNGSSNGALNGAGIGTSNGSSSVPQPIIHNRKLKNKEGTLTRPEDPEGEVFRGRTIAELDLGAEAISICQKARPGADPRDVLRKFQEWGVGRSDNHWQRALMTFATKEHLSDDEQRAAERARHNGTGPRLPGETAQAYIERSKDPPCSPILRQKIASLVNRHSSNLDSEPTSLESVYGDAACGDPRSAMHAASGSKTVTAGRW